MSDIPASNTMRIFGVVILVAGIIQIGVSAAAFNMTSWMVGAWWAGVVAFITGILAMVSTDRCNTSVGCALSVIAIIVLGVGIVLDGLSFGLTNSITTCVDGNTDKVYGDSDSSGNAAICAFGDSHDCSCVRDQSGDICYEFNLKAADNCGQIMGKMPALLLASLIFELLLFIAVFGYSVCTCRSVCCSRAEDKAAINAPGANL